MEAKFSLVAYASGKRVTINIDKKHPQCPEGATKFYVRFTDEKGKRHIERLGDNFAHALAEIRRMEAARDYEQKTGEKLPDKNPQVSDSDVSMAIRDWLKRKQITPDIAPSTIKFYRFGLAKFEEFAKGRIKTVGEITAEDLFLFANTLKNEQQQGSRTVKNYLRAAIIFLKAQGIRLGIPAKYYTDNDSRQPEEYKPQQLKTLFAAATSEERLLFDSFYWSGMRNKEMANLTYGDIDFEHSTWYVRAKDKPAHQWRPKSKAGTRYIGMPMSHTKLVRERMIELGRSEDDLVFPDEFGRVHNYYLPVLKELSRRAGIRGRVDIHKFRSTCATRWLRAGVNVWEVKRRLGHSDLKSLRAYIAMVEAESTQTMQENERSYQEREMAFGAETPSVIPFRAMGT